MNQNDLNQMRSEIETRLAALKVIENTTREEIRESAQVNPCFLKDEADSTRAEADLFTNCEIHNRTTCEQASLQTALQRLKNGTFFECRDCGDGIDRRRLRANPGATRCIGCQSRRELSSGVLEAAA